MSLKKDKPTSFPAQSDNLDPGAEHKMVPQPQYKNENYKGSGKLAGKVALISGGDSGIGRSVAILYAREGCKGIGIIYYKNDEDANKTKEEVEKEGSKVLLLKGDVSSKKYCDDATNQMLKEFNQIDILVNHAGIQTYKESILDIDEKQLDVTFKTNVNGYFFLTQSVLPHLKKGAAIINTTSVVAYKGKSELIDYAMTKGALRTFTYSLAQSLVEQGIRVNAVAPGPIWTPFITGSFPKEEVAEFGKNSPMKRAGQPEEVSPAYVFLASELCSSYITGQTIHVNGGTGIDS